MGSLEMSLSKIGPNEIPLDSPWIRLKGADGPVGKLNQFPATRDYLYVNRTDNGI